MAEVAHQPSDEELLLKAHRGDDRSFGELVSRWERPLFHFVYRMNTRPEDARDICQETFLRVIANADRFRPGAKFSTWMYQIALNLCRDQARKKRRWSLILSDSGDATHEIQTHSLTSSIDAPETVTEAKERRVALLDALKEIPSEQREVVVLKEFEGLKFREIADILKCPESTVKSRMYYGLNGLKSALEKRGIFSA